MQNAQNKAISDMKVGICLPNDILFDDLSVYQHLYLMAKLKNVENPK